MSVKETSNQEIINLVDFKFIRLLISQKTLVKPTLVSFLTNILKFPYFLANDFTRLVLNLRSVHLQSESEREIIGII